MVKNMSKQINKSKRIYKQVEKDINSILFGKYEINNNLIKITLQKDKMFITFYIELENKDDLFEKNTIPIKTPFVEKKVT